MALVRALVFRPRRGFVTPGVPAKLIASTMGLGAFAVAIIAGLAVDNPADRILSRALLSMFICNALGLALGLVAERTIVESVGAYIRARPLHEQFTDAPEPAAQTAPPERRRTAA